ncbi:hypothetical protein AHAS_Ahas05G0073300 [Arachis hypogaea]
MAALWRNGVAEISLAAIHRAPQRAYHGGANGAAIAVAPWWVAMKMAKMLGLSFTMSTSRLARNAHAPAPVPAPAPASASAGHAARTAARPAAAVRATRIDPGWKYVSAVEEENTNDTICNFCGKIMRGGITRAKEHLMIKPGNIVGSSTEEHSVNARELDLDSLGFGLSEEDAQGIDEIPNPTPMAAARGVRRVHRYIARWFYQAGIPLNPVRLKSFQEMLWAVGSFGPNLSAPTYHAPRVPLLNEELEYTKDLLKGHKEQ